VINSAPATRGGASRSDNINTVHVSVNFSKQGVMMPKVGKKKFPYTAKGRKAAMSHAKKTGKKVKTKKGY